MWGNRNRMIVDCLCLLCGIGNHFDFWVCTFPLGASNYISYSFNIIFLKWIQFKDRQLLFFFSLQKENEPNFLQRRIPSKVEPWTFFNNNNTWFHFPSWSKDYGSLVLLSYSYYPKERACTFIFFGKFSPKHTFVKAYTFMCWGEKLSCMFIQLLHVYDAVMVYFLRMLYFIFGDTFTSIKGILCQKTVH